MDKPRADMLIEARQVITCVPGEGDKLGRIDGGAVAILGERILDVGSAARLRQQLDLSGAEVIDAGQSLVAPGFVDCHTHMVFGGTRVQEYAAKMTRTSDEVRTMGIPTGILATMSMTRTETGDQLFQSARLRLREMVAHGTTTVESKSGYGLSLDDELKMLAVNRRLAQEGPIDVTSTFLGAHAVPPETTRGQYVDQVINEMIPAVHADGLAEFCDVFCDEGYFTVEDSRRILTAARQAGLKLKIHTDQYSDLGGAALAAALEVTSADHLNYTDRPSMKRLAEANVVAVLMPMIDFAVAHPRPFDARAMLDEGLEIALATDLCPGCWGVSLPLTIQLGCRLNRLSAEEAIYAATVGGARALALDDRGALAPGLLADLQIWDLPTAEDLIYRLGNNPVTQVFKRGRPVHPAG